MKKEQLVTIASIALIIIGLYALTLNVDFKGHYFTNGALFGIGLATLVTRYFYKKK